MFIPKEEWSWKNADYLNPVFFVMNDKNRQKCAQCTFHSFLAAVVVWKFSAALEKKKPAIAGRNCSAGISAFELPRLLVWEHIRLRSLRPAASPTQQQNNRAQNNPKVISLSCIHKSTQVSMSTVSFPNLQPPIQSKSTVYSGLLFAWCFSSAQCINLN